MKTQNTLRIGLLNIAYSLIVIGVLSYVLHFSISPYFLFVGAGLALIDIVLSLFNIELSVKIPWPFGRKVSSLDKDEILDLPEKKSSIRIQNTRLNNILYYSSGICILLGLYLKIYNYLGGNILIILGGIISLIWLTGIFSVKDID